VPQSGEAYMHLNTPSNTTGNVTYLDHPALNGRPEAGVLVTNQIHPYAYNAFRMDHATGVYFNGDQWSIYLDDQEDIITPTTWNVFIPPIDSSLIVQTTTAGNISNTATFINHGLFNGDPNAVLFVQHVYNPPGAENNYYTHTVSVAYDPTQGQWAIVNADGAPMPEGITFFVYGASPDETAFQHVTSAANSYTVDGTLLDNPATNGNPDAQILVSQNYGTGVTSSYFDRRLGLFYDTGLKQWVIFNEAADSMPDGVMFNVLVIPPTAGAFVHRATPSNTLLGVSGLDVPALNNNPYARVYVTHNWNPPDAQAAITNDHPLGVAYVGGFWRIYNRDGANIPIGGAYNVYYTLPRTNSFVASASPGNAFTTTLSLNNPLLNDEPGAIAITTFNLHPAGQLGAAYNDQTGLQFTGGAPGYWQIFNRLGASFPISVSYNVLIPPATNSFIQTSTVDNTGLNDTAIDNPLTNDDPYALVFITPRDNGEMVEDNLGVYYSGGRWRIFIESGSALAVGQEFNVFVVKRSALFLPALQR
jgi:hypothetical protein